MDLLPPDEWSPEAPDGAYYDVPEPDYHRHPALSRSVVATLIEKSPAHAKEKWDAEYEESDPSLGTIAHDAALRPDVFETRYAEAPEDCEAAKSNGDPCSRSPSFRQDGEWLCWQHGEEEQADDVHTLSDSHAESVDGILQALAGNDVGRGLILEADETELSLLWTEKVAGQEIRCRARLDALNVFQGGAYDIGDLKTTGSAHPEDFAKQIARTGSWLQPAFYERGLKALSELEGGGFFFVGVETEPPYATLAYEMDPAQKRRTEQRLESALRRVASMQAEGRWLAYQTGGRLAETIQLPHWHVERLDLPPVDTSESEPEPQVA